MRWTMKALVPATVLGFAALVALGFSAIASAQTDTGDDPNDPDNTVAANIVGTQLRAQGYRCDDPHKAERDPDDSDPGNQAWLVVCDNAVYRVRLVPDQAAQVEKIE